MSKPTLETLADFLADWSLEAPFWTGLLGRLPRHSVSSGGIFLFRTEDSGVGLAVGPQFESWPRLQRVAALQRAGLHDLLGSLHAAPLDLYSRRWHLAVEWRIFQFLPDSVRQAIPELARLFPRFPDPFPLELEAYQAAVDLRDAGRWPPALIAGILDEHRYWTQGREFEPAGSEGESLHADPGRESLLAQAARHGTGSPGLDRWLDWQGGTKRPGLNPAPLAAVLESFGGTRLRYAARRPSRRYGTFPGVKIEPHLYIVSIIDTSGSISGVDLARFFYQIQALWRQGHRITLMEADVRVQREYPFRGIQPELQPRGGGGTDFDPAIQRAERTYYPDLILYFTDGKGPAPRKWGGTPLFWYLTGEETGEHLPGEKLSSRPIIM